MNFRSINHVTPITQKRSTWQTFFVFALSLCVMVCSFSDHCCAQEEEEIDASINAVELPFSYPNMWDFSLTGVIGAAAFGMFEANSEFGKPRWRGPILFDESVRNGLRLESASGRKTIAKISDIMLFATVAAPFAVATPLAGEKYNLAGAGTLFTMQMQMMSITWFVTELSKLVIGRARPYTESCEDNPTDCDGAGRNESMISGHSSMAFASAGLMCYAALEAEVVDDPLAKAAMCGSTLLSAATVGTFRMLADKHYLSDVLLGAGVGFAIGYLGPILLYSKRKSNEHGTTSLVPTPVPSRNGVKLVWNGTF